jgi:hypothetical protein
VDKAILLLERAANISWRDSSGDNVLHASLNSKRRHERVTHTYDYSESTPNMYKDHHFCMSLTEPKQFLILCIAAGADVYATNNDGETPSLVARKYGREREWTEALSQCGYDPIEVFVQSDASPLDGTRIRQTSKLSFKEYCQRREEYLRFKKLFFEEFCRGCEEAFRPEMVSIDECCPLCGEEFRVKRTLLDEHYRPFQEQYLREQAFLKKTWEERHFSFEEVETSDEEEEVEASDEEEESNLNGHSDGLDQDGEQMEVDYGFMELDAENVFGNDRNGADFDEREGHQTGVSIGLDEAGFHMEHGFEENVLLENFGEEGLFQNFGGDTFFQNFGEDALFQNFGEDVPLQNLEDDVLIQSLEEDDLFQNFLR